MKKIIFIFLVLGITTSCSNEETYAEFDGTYTEITPIKNRSLIKFISSADLTIIKSENSIDNFKYEINGSSILLTHKSQNQPQSLEFEKISESEFKIQNLYPDIPENGISYITFKK